MNIPALVNQQTAQQTTAPESLRDFLGNIIPAAVFNSRVLLNCTLNDMRNPAQGMTRRLFLFSARALALPASALVLACTENLTIREAFFDPLPENNTEATAASLDRQPIPTQAEADNFLSVVASSRTTDYSDYSNTPFIPDETLTATKPLEIDPESPLFGATVLLSPRECKIEKTVSGLHMPDTHCTVCIENINTAQEATILGCGHAFHTSCIKASVETKKECPTDRQALSSEIANILIKNNVI